MLCFVCMETNALANLRATKYQDGWTIWNDKDGVVGFVLTESELDGWMERRNRPRPTLAFNTDNAAF